MINLNEFGVQEMDAKELKMTDGGLAPLVYVGVLLVGVAVGAAINYYSNNKK